MAAARKRRTMHAEEAPLEGHEDFYKRLRDKVTMWADRNEIKPAYREYLLALPDLFHLVARLVLDARVDTVSKTLLGVALAYSVSPFDLLPDFLGPLGFVDDLLVIALAVETVLLRVPRSLITEHWAGTADIVALVREVREAADKWVGRGMYLRIREYLTARGIGKGVSPAKPRRAASAKPRRAAAAAAAAAKPKAKPAPKARRSPKAKPSPKAAPKTSAKAKPKRKAVARRRPARTPR